MSAVPKTLYRGRPSTSVGTLYTSPNTSGRWAIIKNIVLSNLTASSATITLYTVASGGSPSDDNALMKELPVAARSIVVFDVALPLSEGETLRGLQGTSGAISVTVGGVEYTPPE